MSDSGQDTPDSNLGDLIFDWNELGRKGRIIPKGVEFFGWQLEDVHRASWDMQARLEVLDRFGIHAQVLYPNVAGFGSERFLVLQSRGAVAVLTDAGPGLAPIDWD